MRAHPTDGRPAPRLRRGAPGVPRLVRLEAALAGAARAYARGALRPVCTSSGATPHFLSAPLSSDAVAFYLSEASSICATENCNQFSVILTARCSPARAYWITSSDRSSSDGGIMVPSAWTVLRLMTNAHCPELLHGPIPRLALFLQIATHGVWKIWAGGSRHRHGSKAVLLLAMQHHARMFVSASRSSSRARAEKEDSPWLRSAHDSSPPRGAWHRRFGPRATRSRPHASSPRVGRRPGCS